MGDRLYGLAYHLGCAVFTLHIFALHMYALRKIIFDCRCFVSDKTVADERIWRKSPKIDDLDH